MVHQAACGWVDQMRSIDPRVGWNRLGIDGDPNHERIFLFRREGIEVDSQEREGPDDTASDDEQAEQTAHEDLGPARATGVGL